MFEANRQHRAAFIGECAERLARDLFIGMEERGAYHLEEIITIKAARGLKRRDRYLRLAMRDKAAERFNGARIEAIAERARDRSEEERLICLERAEERVDTDRLAVFRAERAERACRRRAHIEIVIHQRELD